MNIIHTITNDELKVLIDNSSTLNELIKLCGREKAHPRDYTIIKNRLKMILTEDEFSNVYKRFYKNCNTVRNRDGIAKFALSDILIKNSTYKNITRLKERIIKANLLPYLCDVCGTLPIWNNKPLVLQLDHINGINNDHSLENLRFICPNCHSQTDTYAGKNLTRTT